MFRKRVKKTYPPGTFVETPLRVMAILQLCIAFTIICWNLSIPFMGDHFVTQRKVRLVEHVTGSPERFLRLPLGIQNEIIRFNDKLHLESSSTFIEKLQNSMWQLLMELPAFELAWVVFAIVISIMILKKKEGGRQAAWILPLLAAAYLIDNSFFGVQQPLTAEAKLYPSEEYLTKKYLDKPLESRIDLQQEQLKDAWNHYVIAEWAKEEPSKTKDKFTQQVADGEYLFTVARVQAMAREKKPQIGKPLLIKEPLPFLILYVIWNTAFAFLATKKRILDGVKTIK